ncbi:MAG: CRP/FNR family transcriptional regulator [Limisphaerales bacterium]|jgi:CRP/FNR family transcriptional regulator
MNFVTPNENCPRCRACPTRAYCVAKTLGDRQLSELTQLMQPPETFGKGEYVVVAGDRSGGSRSHVRSGSFKSYFVSRQGEETVTGFYLSGDLLPSYTELGRTQCSVVALETSSLCQLVADGTRDASHALMSALLATTEEIAGTELGHQINLKHSSAQARTAGFLVQMMHRLERLDRQPEQIPTPMSRTDIANYLGLTLESLSRTISKMKQAGIIRAERDQITVVKRDALETLAMHLV